VSDEEAGSSWRIAVHALVAGVLVAAVSGSVWPGEQPIAPLWSRTKLQLMQEAQAGVRRYQQLHPAQQPIVICGLTLLPPDPKGCHIRVGPPAAGSNPMIERGYASVVSTRGGPTNASDIPTSATTDSITFG
jgi:hypothetical protein